MSVEPKFVIKKSVWPTIFWTIPLIIASVICAIVFMKTNFYVFIALVAVAAIVLIIMICRIISLAYERIYLYEEKIVRKKGVFARYEDQTVILGIKRVTIKRSFVGRIFGYGNVNIDTFDGDELDAYTTRICNPMALKEYLEEVIREGETVSHVFGA